MISQELIDASEELSTLDELEEYVTKRRAIEIGTVFYPIRNPVPHKVVDIHYTYDEKGELVRIVYVCTHTQEVTTMECAVTIYRGMLGDML